MVFFYLDDFDSSILSLPPPVDRHIGYSECGPSGGVRGRPLLTGWPDARIECKGVALFSEFRTLRLSGRNVGSGVSRALARTLLGNGRTVPSRVDLRPFPASQHDEPSNPVGKHGTDIPERTHRSASDHIDSRTGGEGFPLSFKISRSAGAPRGGGRPPPRDGHGSVALIPLPVQAHVVRERTVSP